MKNLTDERYFDSKTLRILTVWFGVDLWQQLDAFGIGRVVSPAGESIQAAEDGLEHRLDNQRRRHATFVVNRNKDALLQAAQIAGPSQVVRIIVLARRRAQIKRRN